MQPKMKRVDHLHIQVSNWNNAETWYRDVLGFTRYDPMFKYAVDGGPLTLEDQSRTVHLALFEQSEVHPSSPIIAFEATGDEFVPVRL